MLSCFFLLLQAFMTSSEEMNSVKCKNCLHFEPNAHTNQFHQIYAAIKGVADKLYSVFYQKGEAENFIGKSQWTFFFFFFKGRGFWCHILLKTNVPPSSDFAGRFQYRQTCWTHLYSRSSSWHSWDVAHNVFGCDCLPGTTLTTMRHRKRSQNCSPHITGSKSAASSENTESKIHSQLHQQSWPLFHK